MIHQSNPQGQAEKKVHIETWGCQMNVADSEKMLAQLSANQYHLAEDATDADVIILNTCHIREKARHKVMSRLGRIKEIKAHNQDLRVAVTGCVAQAEGKSLIKDAPFVDLVLGPGQIDRLAEGLRRREETGKAQIFIGFKKGSQINSGDAGTQAGPALSGKNEISRYVNIQQGCNNFCTFCVVPHTRGREVSRSKEAIRSEVLAHLKAGAKEITLLGQNVNSYGADLVASGVCAPSDEGPFVDLLRDISELPQLLRLRFTTSNPHDFTSPIARLFNRQHKLGRYIHLAVQSGDDEVLQRMRRKVTRAEFLQRVQWLRAEVPDIAISTDLIVGFPGESDEQFQRTLDLVRQIRFSFAFCFKYSPRPHTAASRFRDQIPDHIKDARLAELNRVQDEITMTHNRAEIGRQRSVLFLYESQKTPGIYYGRTEHFRLVRVESQRDLRGKLLPVEIIDGNRTALIAKL